MFQRYRKKVTSDIDVYLYLACLLRITRYVKKLDYIVFAFPH